MLTRKRLEAAIAYNAPREGSLGVGPHSEEFAVLVAEFQAVYKLAVDGMYGPKTQAMVRKLVAPAESVAKWPPFTGPGAIASIPQTRAELIALYGDPGSVTGKPDPAWEKANIIECHESHGNRLPGIPKRWFVKVHRLAEPTWREGLRRAEVAAPNYAISELGMYVFRPNTSNPSELSTHSFGIGGDIDSQLNPRREFSGTAPEPWSPDWMKLWPEGLSRAFVEAMESVGLNWGGRWKTSKDPMHFQLAAAAA